jgi:stage II sporulation protein D
VKLQSKLVAVVVIMSIILFSGNSALAQSNSVSVKLTNYLGNLTEINFSVSGSYRVAESDTLLSSGVMYTSKIEGAKIVLYKNGTKIGSYTDAFTVVPTINKSNDGYVTIKGDKKYLGEVKFDIDGNYIRPINTLSLEDYLKGVVPSEMPASWGDAKYGGLEALKAQAVAARTYVLRKGSWEIDDSQSNQVYKGYDWHPNTTRAVEETQGDVLMYGDSYANALYSSSNGGLILSNKNSWGTALVPYFTTKADPYDPKISPHIGWSFDLEKRQIDTSSLDLTKPDLWWNDVDEVDNEIDNIKAWLKANGKISNGDDIKIVGVPSISFTIPNSSFNSNDILKGSIKLEYFLKNSSGFVKDSDGKIKTHTLTVTDESYTIRFMIGTTLMKGPYVTNVRLYDVGTPKERFIVYGNGFGHGIGMSQYGAYQMSKENLKYNQILDFYYSGTNLINKLDLNDYFHELAGTDRFLTSVSISQFGWKNGSEAVVLGRGDVPADALTGSVLAKKYNSPLLLTMSDKIPDSVQSEISELNPKVVYIIGGTGAISTNVENSLKTKGFTVVRLSGTDRFETSLDIAEEINTSRKLILTAGVIKLPNGLGDSPDALSVASYAAMNQIPIVYSESNSIRGNLKKYILENNINEILIIGGSGAISNEVEAELKGYVNSVKRIGGKNRYDTSLNIAKELNFDTNSLFFARGDIFIDALPGSPLAAAMKSPVILTDGNKVPGDIITWLKEKKVLPETYFLGGKGSISEHARNTIKDALVK